MPLTDAACKNAKCPEVKARERFADAGGLYLEVHPTGAKHWRWKYRFGGKEKRLALGTYPDVPLAQARRGRDEAREVLKSGQDPVGHQAGPAPSAGNDRSRASGSSTGKARARPGMPTM